MNQVLITHVGPFPCVARQRLIKSDQTTPTQSYWGSFWLLNPPWIPSHVYSVAQWKMLHILKARFERLGTTTESERLKCLWRTFDCTVVYGMSRFDNSYTRLSFIKDRKYFMGVRQYTCVDSVLNMSNVLLCWTSWILYITVLMCRWVCRAVFLFYHLPLLQWSAGDW